MTETTSHIYDRAAGNWARNEPVLLSDYTARPFVLEACEPLSGTRVLDLGCGEGYVARQMAARGAVQVTAFDISPGMIDKGLAAEQANPLGISYAVGDVAGDLVLADAAYDLAVAVFLFNYLDLIQTEQVLRTVHAALCPGGRLIFTVPHPLLPFFRPHEKPFWFDHAGNGYFSGRGIQFEGRIWRRDGVDVPVRCVHKTVADFFTTLNNAGFSRMPKVTELCVTEQHLVLDPDFFAPLVDQPLHMMFEVVR